MSDRKLIGRVSATEKYPSSCDDFQFWLSDDAILSPFDIVRVENKTGYAGVRCRRSLLFYLGRP